MLVAPPRRHGESGHSSGRWVEPLGVPARRPARLRDRRGHGSSGGGGGGGGGEGEGGAGGGDAGLADAVDGVLRGWRDPIRGDLMDGWGVAEAELIEAFGNVRDAWMAEDMDGWIGANRFFPGTADAINFSSRPVYIITTKQTRFALALLAAAGVSAAKVPPERVFGHGSGSKIATLNKILAMPENAGCHIQFVEDRYETLEGVSLSMLGAPVSLYLADWGYNTERTRKRAERNPLVQVLSLSDFCTKMQ